MHKHLQKTPKKPDNGFGLDFMLKCIRKDLWLSSVSTEINKEVAVASVEFNLTLHIYDFL